MRDLPRSAAWRHVDPRCGFEVVIFRAMPSGVRVEGRMVAVEHGIPMSVDFSIDLDEQSRTRAARVSELSSDGRRNVHLKADGAGRWWVDGAEAHDLDGCFDVDLGASAFTNALPIRRLGIDVDGLVPAPAAYVRAPGLAVERLEQTYRKLPGLNGLSRYAYSAPAFQFTATLVYDRNDLVLDYPGIATRAA
jgi:hypothetical protein